MTCRWKHFAFILHFTKWRYKKKLRIHLMDLQMGIHTTIYTSMVYFFFHLIDVCNNIKKFKYEIV